MGICKTQVLKFLLNRRGFSGFVLGNRGIPDPRLYSKYRTRANRQPTFYSLNQSLGPDFELSNCENTYKTSTNLNKTSKIQCGEFKSIVVENCQFFANGSRAFFSGFFLKIKFLPKSSKYRYLTIAKTS